MPFELVTKTPATLSSVTPRIEKHGDADVPAVTLGLRITASNTLLDLLAPGLLAMLYMPAEHEPEQGELPEVEQATSMPLLRVRGIDVLHLKAELLGWALAIEYGIDESSAIHLGQCKVDKLRVTPAEGGSIELALRIGTRDVDEESMGRMTMLLGHEINITLIAPVRDGAPVIDGTVDAFTRDHPEADLFAEPDPVARDATEMFAEQHGRDGDDVAGVDSDGGETDIIRGSGEDRPFPRNDAAELEAGMAESIAAAGLAPKAARRTRRAAAGAVE